MGDPQFLLLIGIVVAITVFVMATIGISWAFAKFLNLLQQLAGDSNPPSASLRDVLQRIAQLYSGRLRPGPMYELPRLTFYHQGTPVKVEANYSAANSGAPPTYHLSVWYPWPNAALRLEVYPDRLWSQLRKLIGMRDIEVGEATFDRRFIISGNDPAEARSILSREVRELITLIQGPRYDGDVYLRIFGGALMVAKRNAPGDYDSVLKLVELSLALYDAAVQLPLGGIEFVDEAAIDPAAPICQVCGESIDHPAIMCARCRTPHHRDCWHYFGGCSIYGCRGKQFQAYTTLTAQRLK